MLDIKLIREKPELVKEKIALKKSDPSLIDTILPLDQEVQKLQQEIEALRAERNKVSELGPHAAEQGRQIKQKLEGLTESFNQKQSELQVLLLKVPNLPSDDTPIGNNEHDNQVVRQFGSKPHFDFEPKAHWQLGEAMDLIDNQRAAKVSGSRFTYLKGQLATLEFALIQHTLKIVTNPKILQTIVDENKLSVPNKPFIPVVPPVFIKPEVMQRMGRLEPKDERYYIPSDDLYLIGSAEHTLGPLHMDEMVLEQQLPIRYIGFSTSFRREAGSYGKDTKGILRLHQFDKLEMESFTLGEDSQKEQDFIVAIQEYLMQSLELPYQVIAICTGDMGGPDARQFDINTWMPGQGAYRETHTSDLMTDYQARRLKTRVKRQSGESEFVHMNDATAFAIGRTLIAIMENYQQADGSIKVPAVLVPHVGFDVIK